MLVISAVNARDQLGTGQGRLHELPSQRNLVAGVSAFSHTLLDPRQLPEVMARAFTVFNSARPRPVISRSAFDVIVAPADLLSAQPGPAGQAGADRRRDREGRRHPQGCQAAADRGGRRCRRRGGGDSAIAEKLDAPVFMTVNGRGILKPGHPLALNGNLGMEPLLEELRVSDAIFAIGTEFGETEMYPEPKPLLFGGPLIRVDIDPQQLATGLPCTLPIAADAKLAAAALLAALGEGRGRRGGADRAKAVTSKVEAGLWPACRTHGRLMEIVGSALPQAIVAGDQTEPVYAVNQIYQAPQPRSISTPPPGTARSAMACRRRSAPNWVRRVVRSSA